MKTLHINVAVAEVAASVQFYSTLFDAAPSLLKDDYARWVLDDPRVNFAIRKSAAGFGVDHLGIQASNGDELAHVYGRLAAAEGDVLDEGETTCCYANSNKRWIQDPQGVQWETFLTHGESATFGRAPSDTVECEDIT